MIQHCSPWHLLRPRTGLWCVLVTSHNAIRWKSSQSNGLYWFNLRLVPLYLTGDDQFMTNLVRLGLYDGDTVFSIWRQYEDKWKHSILHCKPSGLRKGAVVKDTASVEDTVSSTRVQIMEITRIIRYLITRFNIDHWRKWIVIFKILSVYYEIHVLTRTMWFFPRVFRDGTLPMWTLPPLPK